LQNPDIQINNDRIQQFPEDEFVHNQFLTPTTSEIDSEEDQGTPEDVDTHPSTKLHSNLHIATHEIDQLQNAAH
jgi:hypothetical protein